MTVTQMNAYVGREFLLKEGPFTITVLVDDMRVSYGNVQALVHPVGGMGEAWIDYKRLKLEEY